MTECQLPLPAQTGGTDITRFNALKHGVLSRYTVLPWEDADEYRTLVAALTAEHAPQGPTEEHLVEELAGIVWRKRRLRLAEAAAHRRGLEETLSSHRDTVKMALVHLDAKNPSERVIDAIRATPSDTEKDVRETAGLGPWAEYSTLRPAACDVDKTKSPPTTIPGESGFDHLAVYLRNVITGCAFAVRIIP
jgi:hypothetical protein